MSERSDTAAAAATAEGDAETAAVRESIARCDRRAAAPLVVFVSKMLPVAASEVRYFPAARRATRSPL